MPYAYMQFALTEKAGLRAKTQGVPAQIIVDFLTACVATDEAGFNKQGRGVNPFEAHYRVEG